MRDHFADVRGIRLHFVEHGEGPAVIFCHGFPAIASSWREQIAAVAEAGFCAIALDMRGYGESDAPEAADAYTPFQTVGDLVGVLDHLQIEQAVVVGHDFGASVAWNAALMRPDRFSAVFAISVPFVQLGGPSLLDQMRSAGLSNFYMFAQMKPEADGIWANAATTIPGCYYWTSGQAPAETSWHPLDPARGLTRPAPEPLRAIDPAYIDEAIASFQRTGFHGALNYYRALDPYFQTAARAYAGAVIRQPSAFLTGGRDELNSIRRPTEESLRAAAPGLRQFSAIPDARHWPQLEKPDAVNAALLSFLSTL